MSQLYVILLIVGLQQPKIDLFSFNSYSDCVAKYQQLDKTDRVLLTGCMPANVTINQPRKK